ncbi:sulfite exporter TauE/SafE family protein [Dongshaea marina]|uniref:sulfite exporter TauE/SafE family protein n=1 Tax=Dongshaea marina TaxID=2047966 RepID=UPI000D3E26F5|nr:sulfite exporter TauE/SafE family protein [Dongshaea marina]
MGFIILGLLVAFFSAGLGVGGGCLLVPALVSFFKLDFRKAASTSLATIFPIVVVGSIANFIFIDKLPPAHYFYLFIPACMVGAWFGGQHVQRINAKWIRLLFAIFIFIAGIKMLQVGNAPMLLFQYIHQVLPFSAFYLLMPYGFLVGFVATLLGVGCGLVIVPFFVILLGLPMHQAVLISLITMVFITGTATLINKKHKALDPWAIRLMLIPALLGAVVGAYCSNLLPNHALRMLFACFLLVMSVRYFIQEFKGGHRSCQCPQTQ